jgi:hypothetical protein
MTITHAIWARSEEQAADLQNQGWRVDPNAPLTHHGNWALLHVWPHKDREPPANTDREPPE